jgi:hypothetical protein
MLAAPGDFTLQAVFSQLVADYLFDFGNVGFPLLLFHTYLGGKVVIHLRFEIAERQVLKLALYPLDAETMGDRRIDIHGLAGNQPLLQVRLVLQGTHVVQPVGQLDEDDADIIGHGEEHLAEVFRLALLFGLEVNFTDLGDAVYQVGNLFAEHPGKLFQCGQGIFNGIVQQTGNHRRDIELQVGKNGRNLHRVHQIRLTGEPCLSLMHLGAVDIGLADKIQVCCLIIRGDLAEDVVKSDHGLKERRRLITVAPGNEQLLDRTTSRYDARNTRT